MKLKMTVLFAVLVLTGVAAQAKTFKWTSASDIPTWDIHFQNNALANGIHASVYGSLVYYNSRTFKVDITKDPNPVLLNQLTLPLVTYFPMIQRYEASIYMLGWGVPTFDALYSIQSLVRSVGAGGDGNYNVGRYSNPQMDALVERTRKETDLKLRTELLTKALPLTGWIGT